MEVLAPTAFCETELRLRVYIAALKMSELYKAALESPSKDGCFYVTTWSKCQPRGLPNRLPTWLWRRLYRK
jgi:hypothetical protein